MLSEGNVAMMQNLWRFFLLLLLLTPARVGSVAVDLAAQPHVLLNGPVTTIEGETVVQPAQGIEGPGNTSHWCAYNVPGQAAVMYGYLADNSNRSKI